MAKTKGVLLLAVLAASFAVSATTTAIDDDETAVSYHGRRGRFNRPRRRTPPAAPARPSPYRPGTPVPSSPGRVLPPPPPGFLLPCNRPDVPPDLSVTSGQNATGGGMDCLPSHAPPPPPPQPRFRRPPHLCTCPKPPGFGAGTPGGGGGGEECVEPLAPMMSCSNFVTGAVDDTPTPHSECCLGLGAFINGSKAATAAGTGDGGLHCLCPFIVGRVNQVLPRPVDPVRLMYLPIACGVVLPPQILFICFTGRPSPQVIPTKFSHLWGDRADEDGY